VRRAHIENNLCSQDRPLLLLGGHWREGLVRRDYLPHHSFLVAVDGKDRVIGFMGMTGHEIDSLFIDPAHRANGLGRDFVAEAASKTTRLEVEMNAQKLQAIGSYEAMGFLVISSSPVDDCGRPCPIPRMRLQAFCAPALR
jgi:putative acetyltransferase